MTKRRRKRFARPAKRFFGGAELAEPEDERENKAMAIAVAIAMAMGNGILR